MDVLPGFKYCMHMRYWITVEIYRQQCEVVLSTFHESMSGGRRLGWDTEDFRFMKLQVYVWKSTT